MTIINTRKDAKRVLENIMELGFATTFYKKGGLTIGGRDDFADYINIGPYKEFGCLWSFNGYKTHYSLKYVNPRLQGKIERITFGNEGIIGLTLDDIGKRDGYVIINLHTRKETMPKIQGKYFRFSDVALMKIYQNLKKQNSLL